jgi:hypothetical protein
MTADPKNPSRIFIAANNRLYSGEDKEKYADKRTFLIFSFNLKYVSNTLHLNIAFQAHQT